MKETIKYYYDIDVDELEESDGKYYDAENDFTIYEYSIEEGQIMNYVIFAY